jgi:hypothetical protein
VVTGKPVDVEPAATVTEVGTVSRLLLLASEITVPPEGEAWLRVTVQLLAALEPRLVAAQVKFDRFGLRLPARAGPVTDPPEEVIVTALPEADDAERLVTLIAVVVGAPAAIVRATVATVPLEMVCEFAPRIKHVYCPELAEQLTALPEAVAADPAAAAMETTLAAGKAKVHAIAAGSLPVGEVRLRFRATF